MGSVFWYCWNTLKTKIKVLLFSACVFSMSTSTAARVPRLRRFAQSESDSEDLIGVQVAGPESEDLTYLVNRGYRRYHNYARDYGYSDYDDTDVYVVDSGYRRGTNRVYVLEGDYGYGGVNALNKVNAV